MQTLIVRSRYEHQNGVRLRDTTGDEIVQREELAILRQAAEISSSRVRDIRLDEGQKEDEGLTDGDDEEVEENETMLQSDSTWIDTTTDFDHH